MSVEVFLEDSEVNLIENLLSSLREDIPKGLPPMFYHTLRYDDEVKLKSMADALAEKLGIK